MKSEEDFYEEYRTSASTNEQDLNNKKGKNKKKIFLYGGLIVLLLAVSVFLTISIINKNKDSDKDVINDIILNQKSISIVKGNRTVIDITRNTDDIIITWTSTDENIVKVDEGGNVTALSPGNASVILSYTGSDDEKHELECKITVVVDDTPIIDKPPVVDNSNYETGLSYTLSGGTENTWTKNNVTINLNPLSSSNVNNIKYAINCTSNCSYSNVSNNKITIASEGSNKVTVIVNYKNNKNVQKDILIKIDKTAPTCTVDSKKVNDSGVLISVTGNDKLSGIKTIDGKSSSGNTATYSTTLNTAKVNELVIVDNALNETKCGKVTTVMCNKYDYSKSCNRCYAAGITIMGTPQCGSATQYSSTPSPVYKTDTSAKNNKAIVYYKASDAGDGYYVKCTNKFVSNPSCSICGYEGTLSTIYSSDGNLASTTTEYYKIQSGTKVCLDSCSTGCQ